MASEVSAENVKPLFNFIGKPNQKGFFYSRETYSGLFGGFGCGKTYVGCGKGDVLSEMMPENVGLVGRLTYPELRDSTRKTYLDIVKIRNGGTLEVGPIVKSWNKSENILTYQNDSVVMFRHLEDYEKLLSLNLGWFLIDQAEEIPLETYLALEGRLRYWTPAKIETWTNTYKVKLASKYGFTPKPKHFGMIAGNPAPTWPLKKYKEDKTKRYFLFEAPTHENRDNLPEGYIEHMEATYPADWVERFVKGSWSTFKGQIYKDFNYENLHGIPVFDIPDHWPRFVGWDHGKTNPTAVLWAAVDEYGNVYFYKEYYKPGLTPKEHAEKFIMLCQGDKVPMSDNGKYLVWMDPSTRADYGSDSRSVQQHYIDLGIFGLVADNDVDDGILVVQELIHPDPRHVFPKGHRKAGQLGAPHLYILEGTCPNLVHENELYQYLAKKAGQEVNEKEEPRKYLDHACDAERYICKAIRGKKSAKLPDIHPPEVQEAMRQSSALQNLARNAFIQEEE